MRHRPPGQVRKAAQRPAQGGEGSTRTFPVILDYCGGARTDALHAQVQAWNRDVPIRVLDNGSPRNRSRVVTHRNQTNTYVGGGIRDCLELARQAGADFLLFMTSDLTFRRPLYVSAWERILDEDAATIQVSAAVTEDSAQAKYPWMVARQDGPRVVPHADILCCALRLAFIDSFGGFPPSCGGWGYDLEVAYQASIQSKTIRVLDDCVVRHVGDCRYLPVGGGRLLDKLDEMRSVYAPRYEDLGELTWKAWERGV